MPIVRASLVVPRASVRKGIPGPRKTGRVADSRPAARRRGGLNGSVVAAASHRQGRGAKASRGCAERAGLRELTYEPDTGGYEATLDLTRVAAVLGGRVAETRFGQCLVIDRRYEADRFHGDVRIGDCELDDRDALPLLDPSLTVASRRRRRDGAGARDADPVHRPRDDRAERRRRDARVPGRVRLVRSRRVPGPPVPADEPCRRAGAAHARWPSSSMVRSCIVTYNGKTFDVPVMETRWMFHRHADAARARCAHFDMLHPARRLWRSRAGAAAIWRRPAAGCRRSSTRCSTSRASATCPAFEIPAGSSISSAAAIRGRSSRCSSTTGSISCRSQRSWRGRSARQGRAERAVTGRGAGARTGLRARRRRWTARRVLQLAEASRQAVEVKGEALYRSA